MLILRHDSSLRHDTGGHPESIARIAAINAALGDRDWLGAEVRDSSPVALETLHAVHPEPYVDFIRAACEQGGGNLDADTVVSVLPAALTCDRIFAVADSSLADLGRVAGRTVEEFESLDEVAASL